MDQFAIKMKAKPNQNQFKFFDPVLISNPMHFDIKIDSKLDQIFVHVLSFILMLFWYQNGIKFDQVLISNFWFIKGFYTRSPYFSNIKIRSNGILKSIWYQNWIKSGKNVARDTSPQKMKSVDITEKSPATSVISRWCK